MSRVKQDKNNGNGKTMLFVHASMDTNKSVTKNNYPLGISYFIFFPLEIRSCIELLGQNRRPTVDIPHKPPHINLWPKEYF